MQLLVCDAETGSKYSGNKPSVIKKDTLCQEVCPWSGYMLLY